MGSVTLPDQALPLKAWEAPKAMNWHRQSGHKDHASHLAPLGLTAAKVDGVLNEFLVERLQCDLDSRVVLKLGCQTGGLESVVQARAWKQPIGARSEGPGGEGKAQVDHTSKAEDRSRPSE